MGVQLTQYLNIVAVSGKHRSGVIAEVSTVLLVFVIHGPSNHTVSVNIVAIPGWHRVGVIAEVSTVLVFVCNSWGVKPIHTISEHSR